MRTLRRNKSKLKYSNFLEKRAVIKTDDEGNLLKTGEKKSVYSQPQNLKGNIVTKGVGQLQATEYGLDMADYDAVLILDKGLYPLREGSLIWQDTEPITDEQGYADKTSADYRVMKIGSTLNVDKVILKRLVNGK